MPDISKITLPSGTVYNLKDAQAREDIESIKGAVSGGVSFLGITTTELTDGATTSTITVGGKQVSAINGALVIYSSDEFVWSESDTSWHRLGPSGTFRALAYKDSASGSYKPAGTVSKPTFTGASMTSTGSFTPEGNIAFTNTNKTATVSKASSGTVTYTPEGSVAAPEISLKTAGSTQTIKNPTSQSVVKNVTAVVPGGETPTNQVVYYDVSGETLTLYQLGYTTGDSISTADVTVKTGDATYEATAPEFTGTGARLVTGNISIPSSAKFNGTAGNVSVSGTTAGEVSQPTFNGTETTITVS